MKLPINYVEKFKYPTVIKESTSESGRVYYMDSGGEKTEGLYSVTTIISKMSDTKEAIKEWRSLVGHEEADRITNKASNIGSRMHDILEYRVKNTPNYESFFKQNFLFHLATRLADNIEKELFKDVDEIWGAEVPLYVPTLYAGRTDLVGVYKGKEAIIDYKNSLKDKKEEHLENYYVQSAAYAIAHNHLFGTNINTAVVVIANSTDTTVTIKYLNEDKLDKYKKIWLDYLDRFYHK